MVRGFSGSLDRDQPFIPGCIDTPVFFILVIGTLETRKKKGGLSLTETRNLVKA
ncbi:hypothetical protein Lal_00033859 [Lupinus albus]|nr:hypothetical protein Lal_00033859 [Lupinus albus]